MAVSNERKQAMSIKDYGKFKRVKYHGRVYSIVLNDERNLLIVDESAEADADGFYRCAWMLYEAQTIFGIVQSDDYVFRFNPQRKEIRMDWKDEQKAA